MISFMSLMRTKTDLTPALLEGSASRINSDPAILGRLLNRVIDSSQKGIDYARGSIELDAIGQFFCADVSAGLSAASGGTLDLGMGVPGHLIEELNPLLCLQNTVIAPPPPGVGIKRMSILRKRKDVSSEDFQQQWLGLHAVLVRRLPGILGYRQNVVLDGARDSEGHMMADGMVELWFPDSATIETAFRSDIGVTTMTHAKEFLGEIATFLVDPIEYHGLR